MSDELNLVNLTPHALNIVCEDGSIRTVAPSGRIMRVSSEYVPQNTINGITTYKVNYGNVELIDGVTKEIATMDYTDWKQSNTYYVVSGQCLEAIKDRRDLQYIPNVMFRSPGELVRDDKGQPIGCKGLRV